MATPLRIYAEQPLCLGQQIVRLNEASFQLSDACPCQSQREAALGRWLVCVLPAAEELQDNIADHMNKYSSQ